MWKKFWLWWLKGVKLHPDIQKFSLTDPGVMELFAILSGALTFSAALGDKRYHYSNPAQVKVVLDTFPHLQVIGAHFAGWFDLGGSCTGAVRL
jgi:predicted TIM-barrel fold metal-dependent hydrolase